MLLTSLRLLGVFDARARDGGALALPTRKTRALLAYLALQPGRRFGRNELAVLLWPEQEASNAKHSLRQALLSLRRICPDLAVDHRSVGLTAGLVAVDAVLLAAAVRSGDPAEVERALNEGDGELLQDGEIESERFSSWLMSERARWKESVREATAMLIDHWRDREPSRAMDYAHRLVADDPFDETAHRHLLQIYAASGRVSAAERHYDELSAFLRRELGVAPEPETRHIISRLLSPRATDERREATRESRDEVLALVAALRQVPAPLVVTDLNGSILGWSDTATTYLDLTNGNPAGKPDDLYPALVDQPGSSEIIALTLSTGNWEGWIELVCGSGDRRRSWSRVVPVRDASGMIVGTVGVLYPQPPRGGPESDDPDQVPTAPISAAAPRSLLTTAS